MKNSSPVVIAGMHRAGTSMLTREIEKLGVFLGNDLEKNHESIFFKSINEKLINDSGGNWDNPKAIEWLLSDKNVFECYQNYFDTMRLSINRFKYDNFKKYDNWGWKDPRNTFTYPFWKKIFPDLKLIIIERHGLDVALSLKKRRQEYLEYNINLLEKRKKLYQIFSKKGCFVDTMRCSNIESSLELWAEYSTQARSINNEDPVSTLFIKYENFLENPESEMKKVAGFLNLELTSNDFSHIDRSKSYSYKRYYSSLDIKSEEYIINTLAQFGYSV